MKAGTGFLELKALNGLHLGQGTVMHHKRDELTVLSEGQFYVIIGPCYLQLAPLPPKKPNTLFG